MAKIAVAGQAVAVRANDDAAGRPARRLLAHGDGWSVSDVICRAGPDDRPFEEQHSDVCIAIVLTGSFQYRSTAGRELMTPGSLLLGNAGQYFECGHQHGAGDRCLSFSYERRCFEDLAAEADVQSRQVRFSTLRVPPVRELSWLVSRACAGVAASDRAAPACEVGQLAGDVETLATGSRQHANRWSAGLTAWEEIALELAVRTLDVASTGQSRLGSSPAAEARTTRIVRMIESRPDSRHELSVLAREAKLSRYHFLRMFRELTGLTPHQYVLRTRLRKAATRLMLEPKRVLDIALDSGFEDVSNFNRAFRAEFGISPRHYRRRAR